jgi:cytoskeletal protein CcmA (bactofilin family)
MTVALSEITTDQYFGTWLLRTNQLVDVLASNTVTTSLTSAGAVTIGNAFIQGVFSANTLAANVIHGGNNTAYSNLVITSNVYVTNSSLVYVGNTTSNVFIGFIPTTNTILSTNGNVNSYLQVVLENANGGVSATTDFIINADTATDTTNYLDIGVNSSGYNNPQFSIHGALDSYIYSSNGALTMGTASAAPIQFFANGTLITNEVMRITPGANVGIGTRNPNAKLAVSGTVNITGNSSFGNNITVTGNSTLNGAVIVSGANTLYLGTNSTVNGSIHQISNTISNVQIIPNSITISNSSAAVFIANTSTTNISSSLYVSGNTNIANNIKIYSNAIVNGYLTVVNSVSLGNSLLVSNSTTINGSLTINNDVVITGNTLFGNSSNKNGNVAIYHTLYAMNDFHVGGNLIYSGYFVGNLLPDTDQASLGNSLKRWNVNAYDAQIDDNITVNGNATIKSKLDLTGNLTISQGNLVVSNGGLTLSSSGGVNTNFYSGALFISATNSRVGVGNTAPGSPLTVNGVIETTYTSGTTGGGVKWPDGTTLTEPPVAVGSSGQIQFANTSKNTKFDSSAGFTFAASSNTLTIGTSGTISTPTLNASTLVSAPIFYTSYSQLTSGTLSIPIASLPAAAYNVDAFSYTDIRTAEYVVQVTNGTSYQSSKILVVHDGVTSYITEYAQLLSNPAGGALGTFSATLTGALYLQFTPLKTGTSVIKFSRTTVSI